MPRRWRRRTGRGRRGRSRTSPAGTRTEWRATARRIGSSRSVPAPATPPPITTVLGHEHRDHVGDGDTEVVGHGLDGFRRPLVTGRRSTEDVLDRWLPSERGERP